MKKPLLYSFSLLLFNFSLLSGNPFADLVEQEDGWKKSEWYGWVHDQYYPWIYHGDHEWQWIGPDVPGGNWIYDQTLGWIWLSPEHYPFMFHENRNVWLAYNSRDGLIRNFTDTAIEEDLEYRFATQDVTRRNGFRLINSQVDADEIIYGGPSRDGIPAILDPKFVDQAEADAFMESDDIIISVSHNRTTRAYPFRILNYHEITNDRIEDFAFAVTYCPLCGTAMVFDRIVNGREHTFGVSGLLYRDNVLMYDHQTESLWNQLALQSQTGDMFKTRLRWVPSQQLRYGSWKEKFPDGMVLSTETGYSRNYSHDPYSWVPGSGTISYVPFDRMELPFKAWIYGILINEKARAYPLDAIASLGSFTDTFEGISLMVTVDNDSLEVVVKRNDTGELLPVVQSFWVTWQGFYPETTIYGF